MVDETERSRRSVLRASGTALAAATTGLATVGTVSADYFGRGQTVRMAFDGVPCWVGDMCDDYDYYYKMPKGAEGTCQNNQQDLGCGTFVKVDEIDFNVEAWVNVNFIEHADPAPLPF